MLNNQHLAIAMQILYVRKSQLFGYQQHTYIHIIWIRIIHRYLTIYCFQHVFNKQYHWILVQIHTSTLDLHCTIYDSNTLTMKKQPNNIIQSVINIINVKCLLYSCANIIQQLYNSFCELFTIVYVVDITFGFNLKQSIYNILQMQLHFHNNKNNKTICPFSKYLHSNTV
jgi:hypothetical protein